MSSHNFLKLLGTGISRIITFNRKMENKNKKTTSRKLLIFGILIMALFPIVSAFGFSSLYSSSSPLVVYPGETTSFNIFLKTSSLEGDLNLKAELIEGGGIATLSNPNTVYSVSPGKDSAVGVQLTVPQDALIGQKYSLVFKFSDVTPSTKEGTVTLASSSLFSLGALVQEKPVEQPVQEAPLIPSEEPTPEGGTWGWLVAIAILIIIIAIIIYLVFRRKKQQQ